MKSIGTLWRLALCSIATVVVAPSVSHASERWARVIESHAASSVQQTSDGGYILAGGTDAPNSDLGDAWVAKLDADCNISWQKRFGGEGDEYAPVVGQTKDGGYILGCYSYESWAMPYDPWVIKLDAEGTVEWQNAYGGPMDDSLYSLQIVGDGCIFGSETDSLSVGKGNDAWLVELLPTGQVKRSHRSSMTRSQQFWPVLIKTASSGGGYGMVTRRINADGYYDIWFVRMTDDWSVTSRRQIGSLIRDVEHYPEALDSAADGGWYIAGWTSRLLGTAEAFCMKIDTDGTPLWERQFQGLGDDRFYGGHATRDGGYVAVGATSSLGDDSKNTWAVRFSDSGDVSWQKTFGGGNAHDVDETEDGDCVVSASIRPIGGGYHGLLLKISPHGTIDRSCADLVQDAAVPSALVEVEESQTLDTVVEAISPVPVAPAYDTADTAFTVRTVCESAMPDLGGDWRSVERKRGKVNATFSCQNTGLGDAEDFTVKVYFSNKATIGRKSKLLKTQAVSSLAAGGSLAITVKATPTSKHKYIVAVVDSAGAVAETNEDNNTVVRALP